MKVAFRTDANSAIGTGHFMRCLTLAAHLVGRNAQVRFVCRDLPAHLQAMLAAKGIEHVPLISGDEVVAGDLAHSHWLPGGPEADAQACRQVLVEHVWDWLVVDHYALDVRWERAMRSVGRRIMVIDDLADRQHDCDMLLDQNYYADMQTRYTGKVPAQCQLLLGPRYALLRDEFRELRKQVHPRSGAVNNILVFFGGADADNYTGRAIQALSELKLSEVSVNVVIGAQHPAREEIGRVCTELEYHCHVQTSRMAELMAEADLAVGAGGSATWERCCLGLPALSICVAENQRRQLADAAAAALLYAPLPGEDLNDSLRVHVRALIDNPALRGLISNAAMQAVDGRGVMRIARLLEGAELDIRLAGEDDSRKLFEWRNHPSIRRVSRNPQPITWETHQAWFAATRSNRDKIVLIGSSGGQPVGVVRFDLCEDEAEVSIYLVPEGGFAGHGRNLLLSAGHWLAQHHPSIKRLRATALEGNEASHQLFRGLGYQIESITYSKELQSGS